MMMMMMMMEQKRGFLNFGSDPEHIPDTNQS